MQIPVCLRKKIQNSLLLLVSDNINLTYFEIRKVEDTKESRHRYAWLYAVIVCNAVMGKLGPSKNSFFFGFQLPQNDILEIALKVH